MTESSRALRIAVWPLRAIEPLFWLGVLLFLALFLASAAWVFVAAIVGLLVALCIVMTDLRLIVFLLLVGSPTAFVFANNLLDALPFVTVERGMVFGLGLLLLLGLAFRLRAPVRLDAVEGVSMLFLLVAALSMIKRFILFPPIPKDLVADLAFYAQGYLMPFIAYWCARRLDWTRAWTDAYMWTFLACSVWLTATAAAQIYLGIGFFTPTWIEVINEGRATGSFSNATEFGIACLIPALCGLTLLRHQRDGMAYGGVLALVGVALVGLFLCKTRAPWLAAALCFGLMFLHAPRLRPLFLIGGGIAATGLVAALPFLLQTDLFQNRVLELSPIYNRLTLFATGGSILVDHPLLGVGFSKTSFAATKGDYLTSFGNLSWMYAHDVGPPHNEWLHITVLTGLPGGLLYVAIMAATWTKLHRILRAPETGEPRRAFALLALCGLLAHITICFFVDIGFLIYAPVAVFAMAGIAARRWADE